MLEQRLDKVRCWFPGFGSLFWESISVFVLDVHVQKEWVSVRRLFSGFDLVKSFDNMSKVNISELSQAKKT